MVVVVMVVVVGLIGRLADSAKLSPVKSGWGGRDFASSQPFIKLEMFSCLSRGSFEKFGSIFEAICAKKKEKKHLEKSRRNIQQK